MVKKRKPKLTVIIPVAPSRKAEAVQSLKKQEYPVEIILQPGTNPSRNRNLAVKKVKTPYTAFINDLSILPKDWSKKAVSFFEKYKQVDVVGGPKLTPKDEPTIAKVSGYAFSSIFGAADVSTRYTGKKFTLNAGEKDITSGNLICKTSVCKKIKFDENRFPGEDPKFVNDCKKAGYKVAYDPNILVYHRNRNTIKDLSKQIFNYGIVRPKNESLFQTMKNPTFLVPATFVLYLSIFTLLSLIHPIFILPILAYIPCNILFSLYESVKKRHITSLPILSFIFFTIHISYGLGFIYGTIRK
tara:strand:+ start:179 stop:1078 length:900 start_codon:yes stop_codon:yes gene_type:complete